MVLLVQKIQIEKAIHSKLSLPNKFYRAFVLLLVTKAALYVVYICSLYCVNTVSKGSGCVIAT